jgi:hypothetical protein
VVLQEERNKAETAITANMINDFFKTVLVYFVTVNLNNKAAQIVAK